MEGTARTRSGHRWKRRRAPPHLTIIEKQGGVCYLHHAGSKPHVLLLFFKIFQAVYKFNPKSCAVRAEQPPNAYFPGGKAH